MRQRSSEEQNEAAGQRSTAQEQHAEDTSHKQQVRERLAGEVEQHRGAVQTRDRAAQMNDAEAALPWKSERRTQGRRTRTTRCGTA